jgi:hypothetical protein
MNKRLTDHTDTPACSLLDDESKASTPFLQIFGHFHQVLGSHLVLEPASWARWRTEMGLGWGVLLS